MKISIKLGGAAFALDMGPDDFRAVRDILIAVVLALPATQPALEELQRAVAAQVSAWSPLGEHENHAAVRPNEGSKVR